MKNHYSRAFPAAVLAIALVLALASTPSTAAQDTVLYNFGAVSTDGNHPFGDLVFDQSGNLYGLTTAGGANGLGGVFELSPGAGGWTEQIIYSFSQAADGKNPFGGLTIDANGNLFGTTYSGGTGLCNCGQVYELSRSSSGWTKTVLHSFSNHNGKNPYSGVTFDAAGNLYGTTFYGGKNGNGVVYELSPTSSGWTETILHTFNTLAEGINAISGVVFDSAGRLYGTTQNGGTTSGSCVPNGCGTVYQLSPPGAIGHWTFQRIHSFHWNDGAGLRSSNLVIDASGNLYGVASAGGPHNGTVFRLSSTSSGWRITVLHPFGTVPNDGTIPASLAFDASGNLWGTTTEGGPVGGVVFELKPQAGGLWSYSLVYGFQGPPNDGVFPAGAVAFDPAGNLYSTTQTGGTQNLGIVFEIPKP